MTIRAYKASFRHIESLRRAAELLVAKKVSAATQLKAINDVLTPLPPPDKGRRNTLTQDQYSDFRIKRSMPRTSETFLPAMWKVFTAFYPEALSQAWEEIGREGHDDEHGLGPVVHRFLAGSATPINAERLRKLGGRFLAFRPYFKNPEKIMVCTVCIGDGDDPGWFEIRFRWRRGAGHVNEIATGSVVPYDESVLFFGKIDQTGAPFVFILTGFPTDSETGLFSSASGALLVGATGTLPSAYPIALYRPHEEVEPDTLERNEFFRRFPEEEYSGVRNVLARGYTQWQ